MTQRLKKNDFQAENVFLSLENEKLKAQLDKAKSEAAADTPKTANATKAADILKVKNWHKYSASLVKMASHCISNDLKNLTKDQITSIWKGNGWPYSGVARGIFRKNMPPEYINTGGGPGNKNDQEEQP